MVIEDAEGKIVGDFTPVEWDSLHGRSETEKFSEHAGKSAQFPTP
jgi:hypothetical protein